MTIVVGAIWSQSFRMFFKIDVTKRFVKFIGKHLYQSLFLIKLQASALLKRDSRTDVFL